jgi:hypothetical protein
VDDELGDVAALPPLDEEPELLGDVADLPPDEESEPLLLLGAELSPALDDGALPAVPAQGSALSLLPGSDPVPVDGSEPALPEEPLPPLLGGGLLGWPLLGGGLPGCALGWPALGWLPW